MATRPGFHGSRVPAISWPVALLYCIVAVFAGSLFVALAYYAESASSWALEERSASGLVMVYGLTLVGGALAELVFASLLWWLARLLRRTRAVHWTLLGAGLGVLVPWALAALGYALEGLRFPNELQRLKAGLLFPLMGPMMYGVQPVWVHALVGAATAGLLWLLVQKCSGGSPGRS